MNYVEPCLIEYLPDFLREIEEYQVICKVICAELERLYARLYASFDGSFNDPVFPPPPEPPTPPDPPPPPPVTTLTPIFSPPPGDYVLSVTVSIAVARAGASIYYTTSTGAFPHTLYAPGTKIICTSDTVFRAFAHDPATDETSDVVTAAYAVPGLVCGGLVAVGANGLGGGAKEAVTSVNIGAGGASVGAGAPSNGGAFVTVTS